MEKLYRMKKIIINRCKGDIGTKFFKEEKDNYLNKYFNENLYFFK